MTGDGQSQGAAGPFGYRIAGRLGRGARSVIYSVRHPRTGEAFALKHVVVQTDRDARFVEQLRTELRIGTAVRHEGLRRCRKLQVRHSWLGRVQEAALLMDLFDGSSMQDRPPASAAEALRHFIRVAHAVRSLNALGYVHCDLKPSNILVDAAERVQVIDLGQACEVGTKKSRVQGTPDFMSPEQVRCEPVCLRTDVFNLGATFYWVLCGRKLQTLATLKRGNNSFLVDGGFPSPRELNPAIPPQLSLLVMACVRTAAARRPPDVSVVAGALEEVAADLDRRGHHDVPLRPGGTDPARDGSTGDS